VPECIATVRALHYRSLPSHLDKSAGQTHLVWSFSNDAWLDSTLLAHVCVFALHVSTSARRLDSKQERYRCYGWYVVC